MILIAAKFLLMILSCVLNLLLCFKILSRPEIHNIFNISLACLFGFHGFIGPLLVYLYFAILENERIGNGNSTFFDQRFACARFQELRILVLVGQQVIANNIMFRFFVIVHADKGFISKEFFNSKFLKFIFGGYSFFFSAYSYLPWATYTTLKDNYPENTVKGRICLGLTLDWDKDRSKETTDVYIKPRLIVIASVVCSLLLTLYLFIFKVKRFIRGFCVAQNSFASIGGKHKRNILTFQELSFCHLLILFFLSFESILIFMFYKYQAILSLLSVLYIFTISSGLADFTMIIVLPAAILYTSRYSYPVIWTNYKPRACKYFSSQIKLIPRRKQSDFDNLLELQQNKIQENVEQIRVTPEMQSESSSMSEKTYNTITVKVDHHKNCDSMDCLTRIDG